MTIEIDDDTADQIIVDALKTNYNNLMDTLEKTLTDEDFTAVYSFNFDEEVFSIIKELKALELIIHNYGGTVSRPVEKMLKETNDEVYLIDKTIEELKKEIEVLVNTNHRIDEELTELKDKIKNLVG